MIEVDLGIEALSLVLGGHLRLIERLPGVAASTSILVRGGAGAGKTALGLHLAAGLARKLDADVAYACVEIVPAELRAIHDGVAVPESGVVDLSASGARAGGEGVRVFAANLAVIGGEVEPDEALPGEVERFLSEAERASGERGVRVLVIDSLSQGYRLGLGAPRALADGLVKFAAERGLTVVLLEETVSAEPSQWCFAVDTVIELSGADDLGPGARWMRVTKHRFAAATVGPHLLEIDHQGIAVYPAPATYASKRVASRTRRLGMARSICGPDAWDAFPAPRIVGSLYVGLGSREHLAMFGSIVDGLSWPVGRNDLPTLWRVYSAASRLDPDAGGVIIGDLALLHQHPEASALLYMFAGLRDAICMLGFDVFFVDSSPESTSLAALLALPV